MNHQIWRVKFKHISCDVEASDMICNVLCTDPQQAIEKAKAWLEVDKSHSLQHWELYSVKLLLTLDAVAP